MNKSQAKIGFGDRSILRQGLRVALADDAAERQQIGAIGHLERPPRVLLHHQDAHAVPDDPRERREQFARNERRQPERRLVEQQQRGSGHQGAADRHHLLLAPAHGAHRLTATLGEARKQVENARDAGLRRVARMRRE